MLRSRPKDFRLGRRELFVCQRARLVQLREMLELVSRVRRRRRIRRLLLIRGRLLLAGDDRRSEPSRLWTTNADRMPLEQAQAPHQAETLLPVCDYGTANALALWFSAELAPGISLSVGPGDPPTHWGMTTAPLRSPVELKPGTAVRARVRTAPARPIGTWTSWAVAMPGADWEEHDERSVWEEIDD